MLATSSLKRYKQDMVQYSLVSYRTKPAIVVSVDIDRIVIRLIDGEERRVRAKDVTILHNGPLRSFSEQQASSSAASEVEEALELLQEENPGGIKEIPWTDFTELAWNSAQATDIVAAWRILQSNPAIELTERGFRLKSSGELEKSLEKKSVRKSWHNNELFLSIPSETL